MSPIGTALYPVLLVENVAHTAEFYRRHFGFAPAFESAWYIHMNWDEAGQLAVMRYDHETIPAPGRRPSSGLIVNLEVRDVDAVHHRFRAEGGTILQELRSEAFGQRHFIAADPNGILVDVITPIPFDPAWLGAETSGAGR